jgi:uncharacterized protein (DUF305 family)
MQATGDLEAASGDARPGSGADSGAGSVSDGGSGASDAAAGRSRRTVLVVRLTLAGVLFLIVAAVAGFLIAAPDRPGDDSVEAGLARDMIDHHAQAVDMATIVQRRTQDDEIRFLTTDIALGQTNQMGQMQGWLNLWGLSLGRSGRQMDWMSSSGHAMKMSSGSSSGMDPAMMKLQPNGLMPGMATQAQVNQLRSLGPAQADVLFLQLMIDHHRGGVAMAQAALEESDEPVVVRLCSTIVKTQQNEITQMTQLLKDRGAAPLG